MPPARPVTPLMLLVMLLMAMGACTGGQAATPAATPSAVPAASAAPPDAGGATEAAAWTEGLCAAIVDWAEDLAADVTALEERSGEAEELTGLRELAAGFIADVSERTDALATQLGQLGPAPVTAGQETTDRLVDEVDAATEALREEGDALEATDAEDPEALRDALDRLGESYLEVATTVEQAAGDVGRDSRDDELAGALDRDPACRALAASGAAEGEPVPTVPSEEGDG